MEIFRVTGPLCGEFNGYRRGIPLTKVGDAELKIIKPNKIIALRFSEKRYPVQLPHLECMKSFRKCQDYSMENKSTWVLGKNKNTIWDVQKWEIYNK